MFNGRDLDGWKTAGGTAPFTVADGSIVGTTVTGSPNSFLVLDRDLGDFILECEVLQEDGRSNSGVQFRSHIVTEPDVRMQGYQFEIDPSERGWTGGIYDEARRGWLYPVTLNPRARSAYKFGRWNRLRIEAIGNSLRTWVNGVPVAHVIDDVEHSGKIALQIHSSEVARQSVRWRDIRIQTGDLVPSPSGGLFVRNMIPNHLSEAERAAGWTLAWDGATTTGWRGAGKEEFPSEGWKVENGEWIVPESGGHESENAGDIVTTQRYAAFEFQLEFRLAPGANSGIKYFVSEAYDTEGRSAIGLEYQLLDDALHPDAQSGAARNRRLAALYDLIPAEPAKRGRGLIPVTGNWEHARIVATADGKVSHWLNGIEVVAYDRRSPLFAALVEGSKYAKYPGFGTADDGHILLQDHGNKVQFRSIKIRPLHN